ncbi:MAG: hypothetical protein ACXVGQ_14390, partial [Mycobacteriaceae bacterium]
HAVRDEAIPRNVARLVQVNTPTYEVGRGLSVTQARSLLTAAKGERLEPLYVLAVHLCSCWPYTSGCAGASCSVSAGTT